MSTTNDALRVACRPATGTLEVCNWLAAQFLDLRRPDIDTLDHVRRDWTAGEKYMSERLSEPEDAKMVAIAVLRCTDIKLTDEARRDVEAASRDSQLMRALMAAPHVGGVIAATVERREKERASAIEEERAARDARLAELRALHGDAYCDDCTRSCSCAAVTESCNSCGRVCGCK